MRKRLLVLPFLLILFHGKAQAAEKPTNEDCFLEGFVNLHLSGSDHSGWLSGWIGSESVNFNVFVDRASGWIKGRYIQLDLSQSGSMLNATGWINSTYVRWSGFNGSINTYQSCIAN